MRIWARTRKSMSFREVETYIPCRLAVRYLFETSEPGDRLGKLTVDGFEARASRNDYEVRRENIHEPANMSANRFRGCCTV